MTTRNLSSTPAEKYEVITRNLNEVLGGEQLKTLLEERDPVAYWGTAPTGRRKCCLSLFVGRTCRDKVATWGENRFVRIANSRSFPVSTAHLGYFVPLAKIADFLTAGVEVKVLLAGESSFLSTHLRLISSYSACTRRPRFPRQPESSYRARLCSCRILPTSHHRRLPIPPPSPRTTQIRRRFFLPVRRELQP